MLIEKKVILNVDELTEAVIEYLKEKYPKLEDDKFENPAMLFNAANIAFSWYENE